MTDTSNSNAEALRAAVSAIGDCGWGCFCDACWVAACLGEKQPRGRHESVPYSSSTAEFDALFGHAYDGTAMRVQDAREAGSPLECRRPSDDGL